MPTLPAEYLSILAVFAPLFSKCLWAQVQVLVVGAILTPAQRTVTAVLRIMGLSHEPHFQTYHRVLNRAVWSSWDVSRVLLLLLVKTFAVRGPIIVGIDDTIERRWGAKIKARGIYRDPVRSSHSHLVKASGLRWLSLMLLVPIPWADRVWALPFLTVLAPSERYYHGKKRAHKKLTDWAQQALLQVRRWLPRRDLVIVADSSFAVITLLARLRRLPNPVCMITRFRLDAGLYEPAPPRKAHQLGRTRIKGKRLPTLESIARQKQTRWKRVTVREWYGESTRTIEIVSDTAVWYHCGQPPVLIRWVLIRDPKGTFKTQALLCTDLTVKPAQIVKWFVLRWQLEVTFREVRAHLGVETQRQWSDLAIARTTPALLGLFSLVTVLAQQRTQHKKLPMRQTAWYIKQRPTFSDALAVVRHNVWCHVDLSLSHHKVDTEKLSPKLLERFAEALCYTG
jgi:DDE superfamily endonuclease